MHAAATRLSVCSEVIGVPFPAPVKPSLRLVSYDSKPHLANGQHGEHEGDAQRDDPRIRLRSRDENDDRGERGEQLCDLCGARQSQTECRVSREVEADATAEAQAS